MEIHVEKGPEEEGAGCRAVISEVVCATSEEACFSAQELRGVIRAGPGAALEAGGWDGGRATFSILEALAPGAVTVSSPGPALRGREGEKEGGKEREEGRERSMDEG